MAASLVPIQLPKFHGMDEDFSTTEGSRPAASRPEFPQIVVGDHG
jgi:hypothetical protein